ncbi:hypothetical protein D6D29_09666 [Aureobasidium pullulans]|nr:hypothetical protein D6D27_10157 [Aureobasidium pullulans]THV71246.1 hypothetical protein D6D29_09666 [Aureobasidium pullulans]TIA77747.1 hypothetical protein D6C76_04498 [Aureobasidium pullulans]
MRGGRKQKHFNNEEALEPETIKDVQDLLAGRVPSVKVKHHRVISGIMFLEADVLNGLIWDDWCFLIAGENPKDHGCVVATRLHTDKVTGARNGIAETTHGKQLNDTEGGIKYTKWCSSLQFQRGLTPTGRQSPTVTRIEQAREIFSRQLLELFKEPGSFKNQNWQRVQSIIDNYQDLLHLNGNPRVPAGFFKIQRYRIDRPRRQVQNRNPGPEPQPEPGNESVSEPEPEPRPRDDDEPRPDYNDSSSDDDDFNDDHRPHGGSRFRQPDSDIEDERRSPDRERTVIEVEDEQPARVIIVDYDDSDNDQDLMDIRRANSDSHDERSPRSSFAAASSIVSPERPTTSTTQPEYDDEEVDMNVDRPTTLNSRSPSEIGDTSPGPRTMTTPDPNKPGSKTNPFDITNVSDVDGDDDDMIILYHEIKADPTEESDLTGGGLGVNQVTEEFIDFDSDTFEGGSSIIQNTPDAAEDDPDIIMGEHVRLVIDIDD